jgi:hypothetical protein
MTPCHDDDCPSRSRDACKLANKLIRESRSQFIIQAQHMASLLTADIKESKSKLN